MAPTAKPNPIPDRYRRVTPAVVVNGGVRALEFYAEVFEATERMRFPGPDGTVAHAEIEIGDSVVIVEEASPYMGTQAPPTGGLDGTPPAQDRTNTGGELVRIVGFDHVIIGPEF
jgi:PhnB protein